METFLAIIVGVLGSLIASLIIIYASKAYREKKSLEKYSFFKNIPGVWYGLHYTYQGNLIHISTHKYKLLISGDKIKGTRRELGVQADNDLYEETTYILEGKIDDGVLMIHEVCKEKREVATTILSDFVFKNTLRGIYTCNADRNGLPFSSPIILKKGKKPNRQDLEVYTENFKWSSWKI